MHNNLSTSIEQTSGGEQETPSRFARLGKKVAEQMNHLFSRTALQQTFDDLEQKARSFCSGLRMKHMPLFVTSCMAISNLNAQFVDHAMIGVDGGIESTRDNYLANRDNGYTNDGKSLHLVLAYNQGYYRGEFQLGVASHKKYQDIDNMYGANLERMLMSQGISLDADKGVVPYIMATAGLQKTKMTGLRDGKEFIYEQRNFCVGGKAGIEVNIAEQIKLGISGFVLFFPNDKFDNVTNSHKPVVVTPSPNTTTTYWKQSQHDIVYNFSVSISYLMYKR